MRQPEFHPSERSVSRPLDETFSGTRSLLVLGALWIAAGMTETHAAQCLPGGGGPPPPPTAPPPAPGPASPGGAGPSSPGAGGPSTPGPAGPASPGTRPGPSTPGPAGPSSPGTGAGPSTPGARAPLSPGSGPVTPKVAETTTCSSGALSDATSWQYWWENNKHDYVDLRGDLNSLRPSTPQGDAFLADDFRTLFPTTSQIQGQIVPDLLAILETEKSVELRRNALIALAKIGAEPAGPGGAHLQEVIVDHVGSDDARVAEAALVALGLLGDWSSASVLSSILHDTKSGRKVLDRSKVPTRTRAHAGYALGLLAQRADNSDVRRYVATILTQPFPGERGAQRELRVACVTSLGLTRLEACGLSAKDTAERSPSACLESEIAWLTAQLEDKREDDMVRAHAATALGRLAAELDPRDSVNEVPETRDPELRHRVLAALLEPLGRGKRTPSAVQQSCVLSLGALGDSDDDRIDSSIRKTLDRVSADSDVATRQFALIALAQVASRRGDGTGQPFAGAHEVRQRLLSTLSRGKSRSKPWAALSLGILGHHLRENGGSASSDADLAVRSAFQDCKSPDDVGSYAIALALRGGSKSAEAVQERLDDFSTDNARGDLALACGMLGANSALEELRAMNADSGSRPAVLAQTAIALRLLGDRQITPSLSVVLEETKALAPRIAVTTALGQVGDRRAVDPLCRALKDTDRADHARAYAAMALGQVADRNRRPWQASLSRGFNHLALASALSNGDGTGLLEMP